MQAVAVIVQDTALRETLEDLLRDEGFEVLDTGDFDLIHMMLREVQRPLVVILYYSTAEPGHTEIDTLLHGIDSLPPHAYIVLTPTLKQVVQSSYSSHVHRPVITRLIPFELDDLLREIEDAESWLNHTRRRNRLDRQTGG